MKSGSSALILILLSLAQLMIVLDFSIVNVALPSIQSQFGLTSTRLQWVVSAYALAFGGFLLLGGRASDLFNRKRVFLAGLVVFSSASLVGGLAQSASVIFVSRAAQGIGASMLSPSALSLITTTFQEGPERNRALGIFSSMSAIGFTTGVIMGGILTSTLSWHGVFFVNVPIGLMVIFVGFLILPNPAGDQKKRGFDVTGAVLISTTLLILVYVITQASTPGESFLEIGILLLISAILGASFIITERRVAVPLVPLDIFRRKTLVVSDIIMFLAFGANASLVFVITLFLQEARGYSPIETGLIFVPAGLGGISGATLAPRAIKRIGFRKMMVIGLSLFAIGLAGISTISTSSSIVMLMIFYYIGAVGLVSSIVSLNIAGTGGIEPGRQGLAAGLLTTAQQIGAAIGVSMASVFVATAALSLGTGPGSLIHGYRAALLFSLGLVIAGVVLALYLARRYAHTVRTKLRRDDLRGDRNE